MLAGKHVICEKPVALSLSDFDEMREAAKKSGKLFTVHQNRRYDVDYLAMQSLVNSGEIGEIINISADESVLGADGLIDPQKLEAITYDSVHHTYIKLGEKVGNAFSGGKKLK